MAIAEQRVAGNSLESILDEVARHMQRFGVESGDPSGAKAAMRVELENNVKRIVQVYWTPFQANIPGDSVGLHMEIAEPAVHWVEAYVSPTAASWVFAFRERPDGDFELVHYTQHHEAPLAVEAFFNMAGWYALTACDLKWDDVVCHISPELGWSERHGAMSSAGEELDKAVQEALKKSTILWLRWTNEAGVSNTMPVWFIYHQDKIYVVSGERQQTIPGARKIRQADVILRWKGKNSQVADLPASVRLVPHGEKWDEVAEKIAEKRLNIPGAPEETARRWRDEVDILEITLR